MSPFTTSSNTLVIAPRNRRQLPLLHVPPAISRPETRRPQCLRLLHNGVHKPVRPAPPESGEPRTRQRHIAHRLEPLPSPLVVSVVERVPVVEGGAVLVVERVPVVEGRGGVLDHDHAVRVAAAHLFVEGVG